MKWLYTTTTTEKGPQDICINLDNVACIKQTEDGRARLIYAQGNSIIVDDTYINVTTRLR